MSPRPRAHLRRAGTTPEERRERIEAAMERRTLHGALFGLLVFVAVGGTLYYVAVVRHSTDFRVLGACVVVPVILLFALYEPYLWFVQGLTGADPSAEVADASSAAARRRPRHPLGRGRVAGAVLCACAAAFFVEVLRLGDHWPELFALTLALPMLVFLLYRPVAALWTRHAGRDSLTAPCLMPWILLLGGAFSVGAAALDWNWFFAHPRARLFVRLFGRGGARVAYALLGLALAGVGGLLLVTGADAA